MSKILYVISARSFFFNNHMRKISDVIKTWNLISRKFYHEFGGDYSRKKQRTGSGSFVDQSYYDSKARKIKILSFFIISISEFKDIIHNIVLKRRLKEKYKNIDLDFVIERSCRLHDVGIEIAKDKKIPYVLEWKDHLINYKFSLFKLYATFIEDKKIKKADYIIVESNVLKINLQNQGVDSSKIKVAFNAVNAKEFKRDKNLGNKIREKFNLKPNDHVIGYLGSYAFYHNTEMLIHLANKILKKSDKFKFLLVGNGKDYRKCKTIAKNFGILNNGLWMINGIPKSEVPMYLSSMNYTILPGSTTIICPIKIMEYMAIGSVVLAPNYDCIKEVIEHNKDGYLFDGNNLDKISSDILKLSNNAEKLSKLSLNAEKKAREIFTWEKTWGRVLTEIINNE